MLAFPPRRFEREEGFDPFGKLRRLRQQTLGDRAKIPQPLLKTAQFFALLGSHMSIPIAVRPKVGMQHGSVIAMHFAPVPMLFRTNRCDGRGIGPRSVDPLKMQKSRRPWGVIQLCQKGPPCGLFRAPPDERRAHKAMVMHPVADARDRQSSVARMGHDRQQADQVSICFRFDQLHPTVAVEMTKRRRQHIRRIEGIGLGRIQCQRRPPRALRRALSVGIGTAGMESHGHDGAIAANH